MAANSVLYRLDNRCWRENRGFQVVKGRGALKFELEDVPLLNWRLFDPSTGWSVAGGQGRAQTPPQKPPSWCCRSSASSRYRACCFCPRGRHVEQQRRKVYPTQRVAGHESGDLFVSAGMLRSKNNLMVRQCPLNPPL